MFGRKKLPLEKEKVVPMDWYRSRMNQWESFTRTCEKFDYVKFSNGCATGYMKDDLPELETTEPKSVGELMIRVNKGTCLLIPQEVAFLYYEI